MTVKEIIGLRFGKLTVLERAPDSAVGNKRLVCQCDCGNQKTIQYGALRSGHTKSCGCLHKVANTARCQTHGMSHSKIYFVWLTMVARCTTPTNQRYAYYGGRGIRVCPEWMAFENFFADMGPTYLPGLKLDRIENDGHYTKENCKWSTQKEQNRNKRNNHMVVFRGESKPLSQWTEELGLPYDRTKGRLRSGYSVEEAFTP